MARNYGAAVWTDVRNAADCPAMDTYRQKLRDGTATTDPNDPNRPNVQTDCPATFGNTDIFEASIADPTP